MEPFMVYRSLIKLAQDYDLHRNQIVADGDSTVYSTLRDSLGWSIVKIECLNHLIKNYKKKLIETRHDYKIGTVVSDHIINKLCAYVRNIINIYSSEENRNELLMKQLILNVPSHIFGDHRNCIEDLCNKEKNNLHMDQNISLEQITVLSNSAMNIIQKINRIYKNITTNAAENFHLIRTKFDHGKMRNYIYKEVLLNSVPFGLP